MEREKKIKSGRLLEVDFYPIMENGRRLPTRAPKIAPSLPEQIRYNRTQAIKKLIRLVNANFDSTDNFLHPTYRAKDAPQTEKEAKRDVVNFLRRIKTRRASELKRQQQKLKSARAAADKLQENEFLIEEIKNIKTKIDKLSEDLRYIYVMEQVTYKTGRYSGRNNWHFHMFITGGLDPAVIETIWERGATNCNRFQPEKFGPESAAVYMSKDPKGKKSFVYSRNLKKPDVLPPKDGKITARGVEKLAAQRVDDAEYWERRYKGYRFIRCYARLNPFNGHWYVSVIMYKKTDKTAEWETEWKIDEWITTDFTERVRNGRKNC